MEKKKRDSQRTLRNVSAALAEVESRRAAVWRSVWVRLNSQLWRLNQGHVLNQRRLVVFVCEELRQLRQEILDSTARRRFLNERTRWQRLLLWLSPTMRQQVANHFQHRLESVNAVLKELAGAKDLDTKLNDLLAALHRNALFTAPICTEVTFFLTDRHEICAEAMRLLNEARTELMSRDAAFRNEFNTTKTALERAYNDDLDAGVKALNDQERQVSQLAHAAGISFVLSHA